MAKRSERSGSLRSQEAKAGAPTRGAFEGPLTQGPSPARLQGNPAYYAVLSPWTALVTVRVPLCPSSPTLEDLRRMNASQPLSRCARPSGHRPPCGRQVLTLHPRSGATVLAHGPPLLPRVPWPKPALRHQDPHVQQEALGSLHAAGDPAPPRGPSQGRYNSR